MDLLQKLSGEMVDACISGKYAELRQHIHKPFKDAGECDVVAELRQFERLIQESDLLCSDLLGILISLYASREHCLSGVTAAVTAGRLSKSADCPGNSAILFPALNAMTDPARGNFISCLETLFILGWHCRGAMEDLERLPKADR